MNDNGSARYIYCVARTDEKLSLGNTGIEGKGVYVLHSKGLGAVVHNCSQTPYSSDSEKIVSGWVISHQEVVRVAQKRFGTVLPMRFNTIIQDTDEDSAEVNVRRWLADESNELKLKLARLEDREEYGVQIFWEPKIIAGIVSKNNPEITRLQAEIESKTAGLAYMYKQRMEKLLKQEIEKEAEKYFTDFYHGIKSNVCELRIEGLKQGGEKPMLINLSCLVTNRKTQSLSDELEKIASTCGFSVRLSGPWPPYSFVTGS